MKSFLLFLCTMALVFGSVSIACATPYQWSVNGHWYEVSDDIGHLVNGIWGNWWDARDSSEFLGGYLATVTSQGEQDFIETILQVAAFHWIGGYQDSEATEVYEGWGWVTGETWSYTNWGLNPDNPDQPDNDGYAEGNTWDEDHLCMAYDGTYGWSWADKRGSGSTRWVVEYDTKPSHASPVPEPATILLVSAGLAGLVRFRRKFRKP